MPVVLIDENIQGQCLLIWRRLQSEDWIYFTTALDLTFQTFGEIGLAPDSTDTEVWRTCQARKYYLLTSNRNEDSLDSLAATIRRENNPSSLPIFTLPTPDRVYQSARFLDRVIDRLLNYLLDADNILGTGRLYLP